MTKKEGPEVKENTREARLISAFVTVAARLTQEFDLIDLLQTLADECTDLLDAAAAGIMLADASGQLQLIVSTSEESDLVEVMALNAGEGPCIDSFNAGTAVTVADIESEQEKWRLFAAAAVLMGFRSAHVTPLRLRGQVIGTLNLFGTRVGALGAADVAVAQGLADVATIGLMQEYGITDETLIPRQLERAFTARVFIEQAKGVIAETEKVSMSDAFSLLRQYAGANGLSLRDAAEAAVERRVTNWTASVA